MAASSSTAEVTEEWIRQIKESFPGMDVMCDNLSLGLSCHIGPDGWELPAVTKQNSILEIYPCDKSVRENDAILSAGKTFACREHFCGISIYPPQKAMGIVTGLFAP